MSTTEETAGNDAGAQSTRRRVDIVPHTHGTASGRARP